MSAILHGGQAKRRPLRNREKGYLALAGAIVLQLVYLLLLEGARSGPLLSIKEVLHAEVLAKVLLVVGVLYVVGTDLLKETFGKHLGDTSEAFLSEVRDGTNTVATNVADGFARVSKAVATGSSDLRKETALAWVRSEAADAQALKEVARTAYARSYDSAGSVDFCQVLESVVLERSMSAGTVFRSNQVTRVSLSRTGARAGLLGWEEDTSFDLIPNPSAGPFSHTLKRGSRFAVSVADVLWVLRQSRYSISIEGDTRVQFSLPEDITVEMLQRPGGYTSDDDNVRVFYNGTIIEIEVTAKLTLSSPTPVKVQTYEKSFIRANDQFYALSCSEPVRNFNLSFNVERKHFRLDHAIVGPQRYWRGDDAIQYANQTGWPDPDKEHFCTVRVPRWVLPGLVLAMTWQSIDSLDLAQPGGGD